MQRELTIEGLGGEDLAEICDHTFLWTENDPKYNSKEEREMDLVDFLFKTADLVDSNMKPYAICVYSSDLFDVKDFLKTHGIRDIKLASVVGFPEGSHSTESKVKDAGYALDQGANEIDMVMNYEALISGKKRVVEKDIEAVVEVARGRAKFKLVLETCKLNERQIIEACDIAERYNINFVKTSTGFSTYGAKPEDVLTMRRNFREGGIKISGGVNYDNVYNLLNAANISGSGYIQLDPNKVRIGESSLLTNFLAKKA